MPTPLLLLLLFPETFPETSRIFPDCGFLTCLETEPETGRRNVTKNPVSPTWASRARKWVPGPPGPETSFVTSRVATFDHEIKTWSGLGKSGAGDTDGNGLKTGLAVLTSLPGNLPGTFPDLPGLRVFSKSVSPFPFLFPEPSRTFPDCGNLKETVSGPFPLPVSLPGSFPDLPGLRPFAFPTKTYDNASGFWCQGATNNKV